ncbi:PH domain-containing protein [Haloarchaeobius amylolyticus]|uniref:PH domain-containing protein n=1 Tax=Haloarchaeobius amylolyticus TaxID=1198296 RepID=UPI00226DCFFC|nr:PH domain-containing protein [Haloarchaeobius amylolyticus]
MRPQNEWFEPERLTVYYYALEAIVVAILLAVAGGLALSGILFEVEPWAVAVGAAAVLLPVAFVTWWIPAFTRSAAYRLTEDELEYRRGVFFQQRTTVPYNRITNVDSVQGPVQRRLDAGTVQIHTAGFGGQTGAELTIDGVSDFEAIKEQVLAKVRGREPEATEAASVAASPPVQAAEDADSADVLTELRRIRELLEQGRVA